LVKRGGSFIRGLKEGKGARGGGGVGGGGGGGGGRWSVKRGPCKHEFRENGAVIHTEA